MSRRQTLGRWLSTSDAALSWGERIVKWLVIGLSSGTLTGLAGTVIGFWADNVVYGLVAGVVLGMLVLGGFTLKAISIAAAGAPPKGVPGPASLSTSAKDDEQLTKQLADAQRELTDAQQEIERLHTELSNRPRHWDTPTVTVDTITSHEARKIEEDKQKLREEIEELKGENERLRSHPGDEELKGECFRVSTDCFRFVSDHGGTELGDYLDPEVRQRNDEVMLEYEQRLGGRVNGLFRKLQRRGWWDPESLEAKKRKHIEDPGFLSDVQDIAKELNAIGHEH
jgi:hypothetical protein